MQIDRNVPNDIKPCSSEYLQKTNPYYIVAPDYTHKSSGIRVLHDLCSVLNQLGYESYVVTGKTNGDLWTPRLTEETKSAHYLAKKTPIVVYPEVVRGRLLNIGLPVRYVLNYSGFLGGEKKYDDAEFVFKFREEYYPSGELLYLPAINIRLLDSIEPKFPRQKGSSAVYFNRTKPSEAELISLGDSCIEISSRKSYPYKEMISILKSVEVLYCYESSAIASEALLCGCAVAFLKSDHLDQIPPVFSVRGYEGIAWGRGEQEIDKAISSVQLARDKYLNKLGGWVSQLKNFILITQEKALNLSLEAAWPQQIVDALPFQNQSTKETASRLDRKKYARVNQEYKEWQTKSTLREIDADIYAEYIAKGGLPTIGVVVQHTEGSDQSLIADTIDSVSVNFLKAGSVLIVSDNDPPEGFDNSSELSWHRRSDVQMASVHLASADWVLTLEAGTRLSPHALVELAISTQEHPDALLFYADEDIYSLDGFHTYPNFKPKFNIELIRCSNYIGGSVLFNKKCWLESGQPSSVHEIYRFLINCSLNNNAKLIHHVDGMLFHGTGQISTTTENLEFEVVQSTLLNSGLVKAVKPTDRLGSWLVEYVQVNTRNTTLVVPTGIQPGYMREMLESLGKYTCPNLAQIILVCNTQDLEEVDFALQGLDCGVPIEVVTYEATHYNHAQALNDAIAKVNTKYVWVCDDDIEFIQDDILGVLLSFAQQDGVGCVEPRLMSTHGTDARLVGGPMVLGVKGSCAGYTGEMQSPEEYGYFTKLQLNQDVSAVSGHCFVFKTSQWQELGGFDSDRFGFKFTVLDFCLKLNRLGYRHVWAPLANAMHQGGRSLQKRLGNFEFKAAYVQIEFTEKNKLLESWGAELANDRFYNRHLSLLVPYDVESNIVIDWKPHRQDRPRVLASPLTSGSGQYRVVEPLEMLQNEGLVQGCVIMPMANRKTRVLQPVELIRARPDTLVLQHSVDDAQLSLIDQYKKALPQVHILQMVDDLLGFVPEKHPNRRFQSREGHQRMVDALKKSDSMIVTTAPLKNHYEKYIENIEILPNCLSKQWFSLTPAKTKKNRLRIGWVGASQHQGDLEIINDVVRILSERVDWVFMGMQTEQAKTYIKEFHSFVSINEYPEKMASLDLDIAIAPLEDNLFNRCKSNLRLLEYGAMSWPVVCSDVYPYQTNNPPVLRVRPLVSDWMAALNRLIDNEIERLKFGSDLHNWVVGQHTLENWAPNWRDALFRPEE